VSIIVQQDATIYSLFISVNCTTCFGWYLQPSSGAHITVSTVSGIIETGTASGVLRERFGGGFKPIPEIPKALQNRAKLNPIVKT